MKTLLLLGVVFAVASLLCAAEPSGFAVDLISPTKAHLYVDDAWQRSADCLQVKVSVTSDVSNPVLKAYFYGADGKLLHTEMKPSGQSDGMGNTVKPNKQFEKGKKHEVFFGIPIAATKWKRAIIVFGNTGEFATKIYPKDDLAKFDFPEKTSVASPAVPAPEKALVPGQEMAIPEFHAVKTQFEERVKKEVQQAYDLGVVDLNVKYTAALDRSLEAAQKAGKLEDALAIKGDKEAVGLGNGVPAADDEKTPRAVTQLRATYRTAISRLEAERVRKLQPLQAGFARSLDALVTTLTKEGKFDQAMAVKKYREELATAVPAPAQTTLGLPPRPFATSGLISVINSKVTIPANSPDGFKFGPIRKGDVITLKYLEGRWKDHGILASYSPDDLATSEANRLVIARPSQNGAPGDVIVVVPPGTALKPFTFASTVTSDQLVLRINANSANKSNPGSVIYELQVR